MKALHPKQIAELRTHIQAVVQRAFILLERTQILHIKRHDTVLIRCVLLLHVVFVLGIIRSLRMNVAPQTPNELALTLTPLQIAPALVPPAITLPDMPIDAPPDIVIDRETPMIAPESAHRPSYSRRGPIRRAQTRNS